MTDRNYIPLIEAAGFQRVYEEFFDHPYDERDEHSKTIHEKFIIYWLPETSLWIPYDTYGGRANQNGIKLHFMSTEENLAFLRETELDKFLSGWIHYIPKVPLHFFLEEFHTNPLLFMHGLANNEPRLMKDNDDTGLLMSITIKHRDMFPVVDFDPEEVSDSSIIFNTPWWRTDQKEEEMGLKNERDWIKKSPADNAVRKEMRDIFEEVFPEDLKLVTGISQRHLIT